jgi:hypothetical protein
LGNQQRSIAVALKQQKTLNADLPHKNIASPVNKVNENASKKTAIRQLILYKYPKIAEIKSVTF